MDSTCKNCRYFRLYKTRSECGLRNNPLWSEWLKEYAEVHGMHVHSVHVKVDKSFSCPSFEKKIFD